MIRKTVHHDSVAVTFILPADLDCSPVSVVGDFNDWSAQRNPLVRRSDGATSTTVVVPSGTHLHFRYLGAHGVWFDEVDADYIDESGSHIIA